MQELTPDEIYALLHTGNPGDVEFYCRMSGPNKNVLEIGCGWGRIAGPLAQTGAEVVGLDSCEAFLSQAKGKWKNTPRLRFVTGDARLPWPLAPRTVFDQIFIPYNTVYAFGGASGFAQVLKQARASLSAYGELWLDVYPMDELHQHLLEGGEAEPDDGEPVATITTRLGVLDVFETTEFEVPAQALDVTYRALDRTGSERGRLTMKHHYITSAQIKRVLTREGFALSETLTHFPNPALKNALQEETTPLKEETALQMIFCARPKL